MHASYSWYMVQFFNIEYYYWQIVPGKKKKRSYWLLKSCANDSWTIVPTTVKNCVSDCWIIVPGTPGQSCPGLLQQSCARCYCSIMLAIVEESCQRLVKNCANDSRTINCVRECWTMKLVTSKTCACDHSINNVTVEQRNVSTMDHYVSYCCKVVPTDRLTGF